MFRGLATYVYDALFPGRFRATPKFYLTACLQDKIWVGPAMVFPDKWGFCLQVCLASFPNHSNGCNGFGGDLGMRLYLLVPVLFTASFLSFACTVTVTCTMVSSSYVWGAVADRKGRKPVIITSCLLLGLFSAAFGFSVNFAMAVLFRLAVGLTNGKHCDIMYRKFPKICPLQANTLPPKFLCRYFPLVNAPY